MPLRELIDQGVTLPPEHWGSHQHIDPAREMRLLGAVAGFLAASAMMWLGQGGTLTFVGLVLFEADLAFFLWTAWRCVEGQNRWLRDLGLAGRVAGLDPEPEEAAPPVETLWWGSAGVLLSETLGFRVVEPGPEPRVEMAVDARHLDAEGQVQIGVLCVLAQAALQAAMGARPDAGQGWTTTGFHLEPLAPVSVGPLSAVAGEEPKEGDHLSMGCRLCDAEGRVVARARETFARPQSPRGEGSSS